MEIVRVDSELIKDIQKGDKRAFHVLYHKYEKQLFSICLRYANDLPTAEDFFQEGQIKLFRNLSKFNPDKGEFLAWASRLMINNCLNKIRNWKKYQFSDIHDHENEMIDRNSVISKLTLEEMIDLIQDLPDGYRAVFNMFIMDGYSHSEIAEKLDIAEGTSKSQLSKARKMISKKIEDHMPNVRNMSNYG